MTAKTIANYREELVTKIVENTNLSEESARETITTWSNEQIFETLNIEPDEKAIAQAEIEAAIQQEEINQRAIQNEHYERLKNLKGADRLAELMKIEKNGQTGSILADTQNVQLESGELKGIDRITAALNTQTAHKG